MQTDRENVFKRTKIQDAQLLLGWGRPNWLSLTLKVIQCR